MEKGTNMQCDQKSDRDVLKRSSCRGQEELLEAKTSRLRLVDKEPRCSGIAMLGRGV
jgi:hypothetical protein